ncbi:Rieske 2Fe-2S domain-containing protein [Stenotrophomonas sp. SORGH_AS_0321]|uniref:Rieske 2Fe-2S domain-containing protein n=1 Tax=Stenotrophomonas sp. SORGH_AS_0321 TaxID=3041787 RepID=UPI00286C4EB3|nr:Rieske 2Fe-2S domain-containing protein [Stenotrophomonas sp. SORGH_AS_0321]
MPVPPSGCTFDPADWQLLARHWFPVMRACDLGSAPCAALLLDQPLVLYRIGDEVVVARDACPHRGVPLSMGHADGGGIRCRYHGLLFGMAGRCLEIPSQPRHPVSPRLHLRTFPALERYGLVWTCLWPAPGAEPDIPCVPLWDAADIKHTVCPPFSINCFAGRQMEGFLDVAHFAWVHHGTFADPGQRNVPPYEVVSNESGFSADYLSPVANYPRGSGLSAPPGFLWRRHFEVHLPFAATLTIHFPNAARLVVGNFACPASALRTEMFAPIVQTFNIDQPSEQIHAFNLRVFEEDRQLAEAQRPRNLPLDVKYEAHLPADRSSLAYRRALARQGYGRFFADTA